jgi:hypothetical protein
VGQDVPILTDRRDIGPAQMMIRELNFLQQAYRRANVEIFPSGCFQSLSQPPGVRQFPFTPNEEMKTVRETRLGMVAVLERLARSEVLPLRVILTTTETKQEHKPQLVQKT